MSDQKQQPSEKTSSILWASALVLLLGLVFARSVYPELIPLTVIVGVAFAGNLGALAVRYQKDLRSRTTAMGVNSAVTIVLILGIVGVVNFLSSRYPKKWDLTKGQIHTLSDQTVKVVKGLSKPIKVTLYANSRAKEENRTLLDNYKTLSPKFELEYVDPIRELTRAKQAGLKRDVATLILNYETRESKVEDLSEEKITNALIKITKDKSQTLCIVTGHGEKNFSSSEAEGYQSAKKYLDGQSYEAKDVTLLQEGKIPDLCSAVAVLGPTKGYFESEVKILRDYFSNGGRGIIALDLNFESGAEYTPEVAKILSDWHVQAGKSLVVDPVSTLLHMDASVALLATFSKENAITKDFQTNCAFPLARPLEILPGAPTGMNIQWIAKSTPNSWGMMDLKSKGSVQFNPAKDKAGPLTVAIAVEGKQKDSKATRNSRLVIFGSSHFATNNYGRFGGNMDFFLNSVSWTMEDESLISIRKKDDGPGKLELSAKAGNTIGFVTVLLIPLLIAGGGIGVWFSRRRL